MAVGRRGGELPQGRHEGVAGTVLDIDIGVQALTHPLRHQARDHVGCATGRPPDGDRDRLAGKILRFDGAERRGSKCRDNERYTRAEKAY
jgi:hypothetical protein